jgi:hypothetical protein
MKRCAQCGGKFGLIRHRWYSRQFCSLRCRARFFNQLAKDRDKVRRWLDFLKPGSWPRDTQHKLIGHDGLQIALPGIVTLAVRYAFSQGEAHCACFRPICRGSLRLNVGFFQDRRPAGDFGLDEGRELRRRALGFHRYRSAEIG